MHNDTTSAAFPGRRLRRLKAPTAPWWTCLRLLALDQDRSSFLLSRFRLIRLDVVLLLLLAKARGARINDKILDFAASDKRDVPATFSALRLAFICDDFCEADGVSQMLTTAAPPRDVAPRLGWASAYVRDCMLGICHIVSEGSRESLLTYWEPPHDGKLAIAVAKSRVANARLLLCLFDAENEGGQELDTSKAVRIGGYH